ncbi:MAG: NAD(P)/FAD-dependent oxidoreductase [Candidatus Lokiarchaeota archaeon]|nr:NAD(P)/FAD-dependent oxidoreductase [Candidatus Lokiarchaeota archaeon]
MTQITTNSSNQDKIRFYNVIVAGAGNGGLVAAATLARKGVKVLLLEQHNLPGGFASSFVRGRFEFETSLHELCSMGTSDEKEGVRRIFEDQLNIEASFIQVPEAYRVIIPEEELDVIIPFGVQEFTDAVEKAVPGSKKSVKNFWQLVEDIHNAIIYVGRSQGKVDRIEMLRNHANFIKTGGYAVDEVLDALKMPLKAQRIVTAYWCYLGIPTSRLSFTIFAGMLRTYIKGGGWVPRYRSHGFTTALDKRIRELGGEIEYNTRIEKILVKDGKITGVGTSKGEIIRTNHVIANISPTAVYNKIIYPQTEVPEIAYKLVNARTHGITLLVVYLGLDKSAEELGITDYSYFIYNKGSSDALYEEGTKELTKSHPAQATVCLNKAIPDCSPPGTSILYITTLFRPETWANVKVEDYFDLKTELATQLIDDFEQATNITIRNSIEEIEVATPITFAHYTKVYNGVIYGYENDVWDSVVNRLQSMNHEKYIDGLEFCGGFAEQGHGYSSSLDSGRLAALVTLQKLIESEEIGEIRK